MQDKDKTIKESLIPVLKITDLLDIEQLQKLQDVFCEATGVASLITDPEGVPITRPTNFCRLCRLIRSTEKGCKNCVHSDAVIGKKTPSGPIMQPCLSGGLWDGGASICVGDKHIANWLIGQVRNDLVDTEKMMEYAREIGADEKEFREALEEVPVMSEEKFGSVCKALFMLASQISTLAYQNLALRQSENNLQTTLDSIGDAVIATDRNGIVVRINPVAEQLTGWSKAEALGAPLKNVFKIVSGKTGADIDSPIERVLRYGRVVGLEDNTLLVDKNGSEHCIADSAAPIRGPDQAVNGVVLVFRDIGEKHKLEEQLRHSQKMDAIGQLAGGVAHDFNNMLSGILGAADLLSRRLQLQPDNLRLANIIIDAADKAAGLTRKLLDFSRKGKTESSPIDINSVIAGAINILERSIDRKIAIVQELKAPSHIVIGDASQLQNALLNLAINARDAMPDGGTLKIVTENIYFDDNDCRLLAGEIVQGEYIQIEIIDTGVGIPADNLPRIFEPFFTTKDIGHGTGLGLAAVYGMVKDHKGAIHVYSEIAQGTVFKIYLPVVARDVEHVGNGEIKGELKRRARILIIDDESIIRETGKIVLESLGCDAVTAENGSSGIDILKKDPAFDLVIIDMIMPGMNGREVYDTIRKFNQTVPVAFSSGFTYNQSIEDLLRCGDVLGFVQKPYRSAALQEMVWKAMGAI